MSLFFLPLKAACMQLSVRKPGILETSNNIATTNWFSETRCVNPITWRCPEVQISSDCIDESVIWLFCRSWWCLSFCTHTRSLKKVSLITAQLHLEQPRFVPASGTQPELLHYLSRYLNCARDLFLFLYLFGSSGSDWRFFFFFFLLPLFFYAVAHYITMLEAKANSIRWNFVDATVASGHCRGDGCLLTVP